MIVSLIHTVLFPISALGWECYVGCDNDDMPRWDYWWSGGELYVDLGHIQVILAPPDWRERRAAEEQATKVSEYLP
jgi:hypothetical protein